MPCMGPDKKYSDRMARQATEETLARLGACGVGNGSLDTPNSKFTFSDELKTKLLRLMEEIFWEDACASF